MKSMRVNLTPPSQDAALIQLVDLSLTPSFSKFCLPFSCLEYGKRFHCLTDTIAMRW